MKHSWKQKFLTIAVGQAASLIGSSAVQFALIWWIASETDSAIMLGISGLAAFLPMTLLSPFAGVLADRFNRKYICICADLFIGIAAAVFAILLWQFDLPVWTALLVLFIRSIGNTFHQPSIQAIIPQLVPKEQLVKANGWSQFMQSGAFIIGPVLGAALYSAFPLPVILLTDLAGALIASGLLAVVKVPRLIITASHQKQHFLHDLKEGLEVYLADKKLFVLILAQTLCMLFFLPLSSFYPLMTSGYFNASAWHGSAVELSYALGMMVTAVLFGSVIQVSNKIKASYLGLFGIGAASAICGIVPDTMLGWWVFMIFCGLLGACGNIHSIPLMAYMQEAIPAEKMGRAFSLLACAGSLTMPLGLLLAGPIAEKTGVNIWFLITGVVIILITAICFIHQRKKILNTEK